MNNLGPLQREWVTRLRSGEYESLIGGLYLPADGTSKQRACCLGVACDVLHLPKETTSWGAVYFIGDILCEPRTRRRHALLMPGDSHTLLGLRTRQGHFKSSGQVNPGVTLPGKRCLRYYSSLAQMNDNSISLSDIGDFIENNPDEVFLKAL